MENNLIKFADEGKTPVVASTLIADGVQISHEAVIKLVRKYLPDFQAFGGVRFEIEPFQTNGGVQKREIAYLTENQAYLLFTFLKNTETARQLKVRLVQAFNAVRQDYMKMLVERFNVPRNYSEALMLAADQAKKIECLEAEKEANAPKVEMAERVIDASGTFMIREVAKAFGVPVVALFDWMRQKGIISKRNEPYAKFVRMGVICPKVGTYVDGKGNTCTSISARLSGKGIYYLLPRLKADGVIKTETQVNLSLLSEEK